MRKQHAVALRTLSGPNLPNFAIFFALQFNSTVNLYCFKWINHSVSPFPNVFFFAVPFLHLGKRVKLQHAWHTKSCHSRELLSPSRLANWHNYWGEFLISLRWNWECRFMSSSSSLTSLPLKIHLSPSIISSPEDKSANSLLSLSLCVCVWSMSRNNCGWLWVC